MDDKLFAPFVVTTLNRSEHFIKCIESLKRNTLAKNTDIYIGLDYPPSNKYLEGYNKICAYIDRGIEGFKSVHVIRRDYNFGPSKNLMDIIETVFSKYENIIISEDDNEFSPYFLEYINKGLNRYRYNEDVVAICGYSHNIQWHGNAPFVGCNTFFSAWGFGMWKEFYYSFRKKVTRELFQNYAEKKEYVQRIQSMAPRNFPYFYTSLFDRGDFFYDSTISIYMILNNKYCIMPRKTLVKNNGWDGSGIHCTEKEQFIYVGQDLDTVTNTFEDMPISVSIYKEDVQALSKIYPPEDYERFRRYDIRIKIMQFVGVKKYFMFYEWARKNTLLKWVKNLLTKTEKR